MKRYLLMILIGVLTSAASAWATRCFRPDTVPACQTPVELQKCYMIGTQAEASYASCTLCHNDVRRIG